MVVAITGIFPAGRHHHHLVGCLNLGGHLGQLELDRPVLGNRLAEGVPPLRVGNGQFEGAESLPAAAGGDIDPRAGRRNPRCDCRG
jgi:hypothetical protein